MAEADPRERIREAALRQFAARGFEGATVRGVAQDAGVSPGLVQHHFPSKQALRDECDTHVLAVMRGVKDQVVADGAVAEDAFLADVHQAVAPLVPYLAMTLLSDARNASWWFDELAELYGRVLTSGEMGPALLEGEDVEAIVAVHTAMELGLAMLAQHVFCRLGTGQQDPSAVARVGRAKLFLAAERLIDTQLESRIRAGLDQYEQTSAGTGEADAH